MTTHEKDSLEKQYSVYNYVVSTYISGLKDIQQKYVGKTLEDRIKDAEVEYEKGNRATLSPLTKEIVEREKGFAELFQNLKLSNEKNLALYNTVYSISASVSAGYSSEIEDSKRFKEPTAYLQKLDEVEKGYKENLESNEKLPTITLDGISYNVKTAKSNSSVKNEFAEQFVKNHNKDKIYITNGVVFETPKVATVDNDGKLKLAEASTYNKQNELIPTSEYLKEIKRAQRNLDPLHTTIDSKPFKPIEISDGIKDIFRNIDGGAHFNSIQNLPSPEHVKGATNKSHVKE